MGKAAVNKTGTTTAKATSTPPAANTNTAVSNGKIKPASVPESKAGTGKK